MEVVMLFTDLSTKICVQNETKDVNVKVLNVITRINEAEIMVKRVSFVTVNVDSIVQHVIQIKNGIMKHVYVSVKIMAHTKRIIVGILAHVFMRMISI